MSGHNKTTAFDGLKRMPLCPNIEVILGTITENNPK